MSAWKETGHDGSAPELEYQEIGLVEEDFDHARRFFLIRFPWADHELSEDEVKAAVRRNFQEFSCTHTHDCCGCAIGHAGELVGVVPYSNDQWVVSQLTGRNV